MIEIEHGSKQFGDQKVLQDINMQFEPGKIYGIVGRNGSGKTVLFKCLIGFVKLDEGTVKVNDQVVGKDIDVIENTGIIIETPGFLNDCNGFKNLKYLAMLKKRISDAQIREAIQMVGLDPSSKKRVGKYSLCMRQRLGIAQAIMEDPDNLILDEPMNGLDNQGVADIRSLLLQLKEKGKTILIASHNREDIDILCDHVWEMDKGIAQQMR